MQTIDRRELLDYAPELANSKLLIAFDDVDIPVAELLEAVTTCSVNDQVFIVGFLTECGEFNLYQKQFLAKHLGALLPPIDLDQKNIRETLDELRGQTENFSFNIRVLLHFDAMFQLCQNMRPQTYITAAWGYLNEFCVKEALFAQGISAAQQTAVRDEEQAVIDMVLRHLAHGSAIALKMAFYHLVLNKPDESARILRDLAEHIENGTVDGQLAIFNEQSADILKN